MISEEEQIDVTHGKIIDVNYPFFKRLYEKYKERSTNCEFYCKLDKKDRIGMYFDCSDRQYGDDRRAYNYMYMALRDDIITVTLQGLKDIEVPRDTEIFSIIYFVVIDGVGSIVLSVLPKEKTLLKAGDIVKTDYIEFKFRKGEI